MISKIRIQIKVEGHKFFPTRAELEVRNQLEDSIMDKNIGGVVDVGSGLGVMDIMVEAEDANKAMTRISAFLRELHIENKTNLQVVKER